MRTTTINTKSDNVFIFNMLNKTQFTNKADVCEQAVRIQEFKFAYRNSGSHSLTLWPMLKKTRNE